MSLRPVTPRSRAQRSCAAVWLSIVVKGDRVDREGRYLTPSGIWPSCAAGSTWPVSSAVHARTKPSAQRARAVRSLCWKRTHEALVGARRRQVKMRLRFVLRESVRHRPRGRAHARLQHPQPVSAAASWIGWEDWTHRWGADARLIRGGAIAAAFARPRRNRHVRRV